MTAQLATLLQDALGPDYRLEHELEGGGMSRLFLATDLRLNRRVVVKVLSPELISATSTARFKREIELMVKLQHPHILPVLTTGSFDDVLYYITPFIPGESLKARIEREGKLPLDDILKILRDAAGALAFAHARGVVHRDIKPGNILLAEGHAILADFGIARPSSTTATQLTATGVMVGTPAYMAAGLRTDEQGDVYALGIVGCEMLIGALPPRDVRSRDIIAMRGDVAGDVPSTLKALATILERAVTLEPQRRISVVEFATAVAGPIRPRLSAAVVVGAISVVVVLVVGAGLAMRGRPRKIPAPHSPYIVLPFAVHGSADSAQGTMVTDRVRDAIAEWREDTLIDPRVAQGEGLRTAGDARTLAGGLALAGQLGAATLVWGNVDRQGDSATLTVSLYTVSTRDLIATDRRRYSVRSDTALITTTRKAVSMLLRNSDEIPWASATDRHRALLAAWRSYDEGRAALQRWDLAGAERGFHAAIALESDMGRAHLWLAQTLYWEFDPQLREERRAETERAVALKDQLSGRDLLLAHALDALTDTRFPVACEFYREMIRADSTDVAGWLGLSDCQQRDPTVIRDSASPSGWRFRASFADAERALRRASYIAPASMDANFRSWYVTRLRSIVEVGELRFGLPLGGGDPMYARPYLDHDTLAFVPYTAADIASGKADPPAAARDSAERYANGVVQHAIDLWIARAPNDPAAWLALAKSAEATNGATLAGRRYSPIEIARRATRFAKDSSARISLAVMETRLYLKRGDFDRARATADSALRDGAAGHPEVAGVAGLAAIVGHVREAAELLAKGRVEEFAIQLPNGTPVNGAPPVLDAARRLLVYSSFGAPTDTLRAMAEQVTSLVDRFVSDSALRAEMRSAILLRALSLTYPENSDAFIRSTLAGMPGAPTLRARGQLALARGDSTGARVRLDSLRRQRPGAVAAAPVVDGVLRRAELALALGDTTGAVEELDGVLLALPSLGVRLLDEVSQSAGLVRAAVLRARLASARGDHRTAQHWAAAVVAMWRDADPELQPVVKQMEAISRS